MMTDARRGRFDVVLVWACDRIARSTRHFLDVLDDLNRIGVEFVSFMEQIDTDGPAQRATGVDLFHECRRHVGTHLGRA